MGRLKKTFAEDSGHVFFHRQNVEDSNSPNNAAEFIMSKRNKVLDDALFAFFTKEAVKSLKRNFTSFCKENPLMSEKKRCKGDSVDSCVFTRFSVKYFFDVLSKLNPYQRNVITKFGFGCLLMAENCEIPSEFVQWIAHHVDTITSEIVLDDKTVIPIRKESVHFVLGLPVDGIEIISDSAAGRKFIFSQFQLASLPDITFFGDKLKGLEDISDEDIFVCFMIIAVSCFLCPNSNLRTNTEFLSVFQDPEKAQGFDFCKLVYDCLMLSISKLNKKGKVTGRKPKIRGFCKYFLAPNNSPDVEIVGARDFSVRCNQLSKETDIAYNSKMYSAIPEDNSFNDQLKAKPLSTSQARLSNIESQDNDNGVPSRVKEVVHDQRRVNFLPKCTSGPSSDKNKRFPVSDDDRRNYTAIIKLGQTATYQKQYAIIYTRVHCSYESLGESMMPEGHVDNFLLPCFCRKLFEDCHPKISGKHHFFSYIGETILKYKHSQGQKDLIFKYFHGAGKASKGSTLKSSNMLFFPICHGEHWFLFVVHLKYHLFAFLESLYDSDFEYHAEVRRSLIDNFILLSEEMVDPQYNFAKFCKLQNHVAYSTQTTQCG